MNGIDLLCMIVGLLLVLAIFVLIDDHARQEQRRAQRRAYLNTMRAIGGWRL